jgi:Na+-transporting NADH:ubiquinone oxidoreductase subunit NqrB
MKVLVYSAWLVCGWFGHQLAGVAVAHNFAAPQLVDQCVSTWTLTPWPHRTALWGLLALLPVGGRRRPRWEQFLGLLQGSVAVHTHFNFIGSRSTPTIQISYIWNFLNIYSLHRHRLILAANVHQLYIKSQILHSVINQSVKLDQPVL